jgi:glyoxylase-like metal-dependent hydrolase (beta-lactamase superfamily II)
MTYTGVVTAGGPPDVQETSRLTIVKASVGNIDNNVYLLRCRATGEQLLIDAADEPDTLFGLIGDGGLAAVFTTHQHWDHHRALPAVVDATAARVLVGRQDAVGLPVPANVLLEDGDTVRVGEVELTARHLAGHSPGSIALVYRDPDGSPHVFSGDSLFPGGPGKTTNPVDFTSLMDGIEAKLFEKLPDETWVYPGHGNDTTLGDERPNLAKWRARGW